MKRIIVYGYYKIIIYYDLRSLNVLNCNSVKGDKPISIRGIYKNKINTTILIRVKMLNVFSLNSGRLLVALFLFLNIKGVSCFYEKRYKRYFIVRFLIKRSYNNLNNIL